MTTSQRKRCTREFKEEAIKLKTEFGCSISEAARNLNIHPNLLIRWKRGVWRGGKGRLPWKQGSTPDGNTSFAPGKQTPSNRARDTKKGGSLLGQRAAVMFKLMNRTKKAYPLSLLCRVQVSSATGILLGRQFRDHPVILLIINLILLQTSNMIPA